MQRVADALGYSPDMLIESAHAPGFPDEIGELLRLWARIGDPAGRRRALAAIRALAEADEP
ncbi:hypothetical protein FF100_18470 [Methylobacterium terricola]|uniref:Uncharacterized protein n=1 Tax=Methylobacterium terricola TaxID=2583531 RepID=A0A5C4LFF1_9HYPH|nr:hypothetical protein FF100_18470 [Methylobacterium terricola]